MAAKMQFFDALALAAVVRELATLGECRIDKVGQPSAHALYFNLRAGGKNLRLFLSVGEQWARMHLTTRNLPNMPVPSAFTMQLRKHLEGSRLLRVEQPGLERVARLVVAGRDELGDPFERVLVAELIGKYANLFLVDAKDDLVMGCLRPITEAMCQVRQVMPGLPYDPPPVAAGKREFAEGTDEDAAGLFSGEGRLADALSARFAGLGKAAAGQLIRGLGYDPGVAVDELEAVEPLVQGLRRARRNLASGWFYPRLEAGPGWDYDVWWLGDGPPPESSASALVDDYYGGREARHLLEERRKRVASQVGDLLRKQRERLAGWEDTLGKSEAADRYREMGDLLTSHMYLLSPGMERVEVTDFYASDQGPVTIQLDPRLTPSENVQRFFKRYQKARNSRQVVEGLLEEGRAELGYLEAVATAVAIATEPRDLTEIADELAVLQGKPLVTQRHRGQPADPPPAPLKFVSSDGLTMWVGKNNKQNDHLTFKLARPQDVWLHAQNIPGSHVVVQADGEVPEQTLLEAAGLAAFYSQARESGRVPVVYTRRKHVRKPRGARPGMVIYEQEKTLFVAPTGAP